MGNGSRLPARHGQNDHAIALGRKNFLFCGSEGGGRRAALIYSLIESAKLNGIDPKAYLLDVLTKMPTAKRGDLDALMPWNFAP